MMLHVLNMLWVLCMSTKQAEDVTCVTVVMFHVLNVCMSTAAVLCIRKRNQADSVACVTVVVLHL